MRLSIVVIGKEEEQNLEALFISLEKISTPYELLYVDSASEDGSVNIASRYADRICVLEASSQLCAAAGRNVGTLEAKGEWVLYLDGDMILSEGFAGWIDEHIEDIDDALIAGYVGPYTYIYRDGDESQNRHLLPASGRVGHFGGAVLLRRETVLEVGNWNASVVSNEEIDLYARIQKSGKYVEAVDIEMVRHLAAHQSPVEILMSMFWPMNRRYYGLGQVLRSQLQHGSFLMFMRYYPFAFIFWALIMVALLTPMAWYLFLGFILYIAYTKRPHYLLIYLTDLPRGLFGLFSYKAYVPLTKCHTPSGIL